MQIQDHPLTGVRTRRQYLGISSEQMADRLGMKRTSYLRFERGERRAYLDHAHVIASMLDCTVDDLARLPTPEEVKELYSRARPQPEARIEPTPDEPIGTVVDAHTTTSNVTNDVDDTEPASSERSEPDLEQLVSHWADDDD